MSEHQTPDARRLTLARRLTTILKPLRLRTVFPRPASGVWRLASRRMRSVLMTAVLIAVAALLALAAVFGAVLGFASEKFKVEGDPIVDQIDSLLPQTQCGQCGHPGCRPYAEAIAEGEDHNRCPPGGQDTVDSLTDLLGRDELTLDDEGAEDADIPKVAYIREDECIGCTKCIQACPVDAIVGAAKLMHTVIVDECTGCDLCVEPCPVDCIDMVEVKPTLQTWGWNRPAGIGQRPDSRIEVVNL